MTFTGNTLSGLPQRENSTHIYNELSGEAKTSPLKSTMINVTLMYKFICSFLLGVSFKDLTPDYFNSSDINKFCVEKFYSYVIQWWNRCFVL